MGDRKIVKRKLVLEGLLALLIALSPLFFYSYKYLPYDSVDTWTFLGMDFTANGYEEIAIAFYFYLSKLIPLLLLIIWFVTCKHWWYHAILIPIAMYAFQSYGVFSEDISKIDENEFFYLLLVCMVVIPIVYFIRIKLVDKYVHGIDLEAMEAEIQTLKEKQGIKAKKAQSAETPIAPAKTQEEIGYKSLSEKIDEKLSTNNLESIFRQFQNQLGNWLNFH